MRLFQIEQHIFDLDKITQVENLQTEHEQAELVLNFVDGLPLLLTGDAAELVWAVLGSMACKLSLDDEREVA